MVRLDAMPGTLDDAAVRDGVPRGPFGLRQRRLRARVFGEPAFDVELCPADVCPEQPHVIAYDAWRRMVEAAAQGGLDPAPLAIHSAYRSVALQREIWEYRLAERRRAHPELSEREVRRQQRVWTAVPGQSAHHTGFALDLALYALGRAGSRRAPAYAWLAKNAVHFGFYPYLPEGWHWEYNPPGLVAHVRELRRRIAAGEPFEGLLRALETS